ncbi:O-antigen ligase domain-containing protein [bacterium]|nr:O-antigen ligase domain-containing protein [bacterium]
MVFDEETERLYSFVFSYEDFGEILAALSPLVIYKMVKYKKSVWVPCLIIFTVGVLMSVTRSGIILFTIGTLFSMLYHYRKELYKAYMSLTLFAMTIIVAAIYIKPAFIEDVFKRFGYVAQEYSSTGDMLVAANRGNFPDAWDHVYKNLTFFGHSLARVDYHNLFLTTLEQLGIIGSLIFFVVLLNPLIRLLRAYGKEGANNSLVFSCILSLVLFLFNETKYEFTRTASYNAICWVLMGIYYLAAKKLV